MSSDFVRYSPEIETIDPEGAGRAVRGAHAKTLGVVKADVEILGDVPAPYAQGIYAKPVATAR